MIKRLWPYLLAGLFGLGIIVALVALPKQGDDKIWASGTADVTIGSGQVVNSTQSAAVPTLQNDIAETETAPASGAATDQPFLPQAGEKALTPATKDLLEDSSQGAVPVVAKDGRAPWHYYACAVAEGDTRPKLAVVLRDMGLSGPETLAAANGLPAEVTLGFSPYGDDTLKLMEKARAAGHETLLQLPLEVAANATQDPGPRSLSSKNTAAQNNENLLWNLSRAQAYTGVITDGGGKLVTTNDLLEALMKNIMSRGLLFIDDTKQAQSASPLLAEQLQAPWGRTALQLDSNLTTDAIDVAFGRALATARSDGRIIVTAANTPMMRTALVNWAARLKRENVALVPVSAIVTVGAASSVTPATTAAPAPPPLAPDADAARSDDASDAAPDARDDLSSMAPAKTAVQPDGSVNLLSTDKAAGSVPTTVVPNSTPKPNLLDPSKTPVTAAPAPAAKH